MSRKYGSFDVTFKGEDGEMKTHTVSPLSQHDLSNGWRLVLPKKKTMMKSVKDKDGNDLKVFKTNESFFKINLAQLPPYLVHKLRRMYKQGQFTHYQARDNCYVYLVQPTPVDKEIFKLHDYIDRFQNYISYLNITQKEEIKSCLESVNETDVKGWVVMKANKMFKNL